MLGDWCGAGIMPVPSPSWWDPQGSTQGSPGQALAFTCCFLVKEHSHRKAQMFCLFLITATDRLRIQLSASQKWQADHSLSNREITITSEKPF